MKIKGLQKLTLLDYPEKIACTVFTGGCNFRCPFCHNASLVYGQGDEISEAEFFDFLEKRKAMLNGVCVTGGEPTLQPDLENFLRKIKEMEYLVKLDTNGYKPDVLKHLVKSGLVDYVAMDIKNSKEKYSFTTDIKDFDIAPICESVDFLMEDTVDYEFRTTVVREFHNERDIQDIAEWIKGAKKYFLQCFVDSGDLIGENFGGYDQKSMENLLKITKKIIPSAEIRGL